MSRYNISYFFKEGFKGVFSHGFMSFASVSVVTVCLLLTGTVSLLVLSLNRTIASIGSTGDIRAYVAADCSDALAEKVLGQLAAIGNVRDIRYIGKEEAMEELREDMGDYAAVLDGLEEDNPLRSGFQIWVDDIDNYGSTVAVIRDIEGIETVYDNLESVNVLQNIRRILSAASLGFVIMLGLVSIFIISNTIKLATFDRREEIAIMKMVGATNRFVRTPFVIESVILSIIAAAVAFILQWAVARALGASALSSLEFVEMADFADYQGYYAAAFVTVAVILGVIGSSASIRKFLRV